MSGYVPNLPGLGMLTRGIFVEAMAVFDTINSTWAGESWNYLPYILLTWDSTRPPGSAALLNEEARRISSARGAIAEQRR